jgi:SAM-dependent methyltransferase
MNEAADNWRERLYAAYVSSGQATVQPGGAEQAFRPRAPFLRRLIRQHLPAAPPLAILDLGCGPGPVIHFLAEAGHRNSSGGGSVVGVDASAEQVALARSLGVEGVVLGDLSAFLAAAADRAFDVVFAMDILEHLDRPALFQTLDQIRRVLKPGGRAILHIPNAEGIFGARIRFGDLTHEMAFTTSSIRQALHTCGFPRVQCFEDAPIGSSFLSNTARRAIWFLGGGAFRLLYAAESGSTNVILSQNMTVVAE